MPKRRSVFHSAVTILIVINAAQFVGLTVNSFIMGLSAEAGAETPSLSRWLDLPPGMGFTERPWTLLTYMFTQTDIWHAIFNMLWLFWFGTVLEHLRSPRSVAWLYIISGLAGAASYIAGSLIWPATAGAGLQGASAAVMGIVTATACLVPDMRMRLILFGDVKVKWIAIATIALFALGLTGSNAGAHLAHIGGVVAGALRILVPRLWRRLREGTSDAETTYISEAAARAELDRLLDKVRVTGYGSLTGAERRRLAELSHKI